MSTETEAKKEQALKDFTILFEELKSISSDYKLDGESAFRYLGEKAIQRKTSHGYVNVYMYPQYARGYYHSHVNKIFIRIDSSSYRVKHDGYWTFTTKHLADRVHDKCTEILDRFDAEDKAEKKRHAQEVEVRKVVEDMYASFKDKNWSMSASGPTAHFRLDFGEDVNNNLHIDAAFNNEDKKFKITSLDGLTKEQFDQIIRIVGN